MPEYLSPGVYIEELSTGPKPIEGVSTSTAGFVGMTERGPTDARMVTSWLDYQRWYGGYLPLTDLIPALRRTGFLRQRRPAPVYQARRRARSRGCHANRGRPCHQC